jgi:uncharacterized protein (TIRG00374 family)
MILFVLFLGNQVNKKVKFLLKLLLSVIVLFLLFRKFSFSEASMLFSKLDYGYLLLVILMHFILNILLTWRWRILLSTLGSRISMPRLLRYHFIGLFFQVVLPASSGTDIVKGIYLSRTVDRDQAFASVIMARIFGVGVVIIFALSSYLLRTDLFERSDRVLHHFVTALILLFIFYILFLLKADARLFKKLPERLNKNPLFSFLKGIHLVLIEYRKRRSYVLKCILISVCIVFSMVLIHFFLFYALGIRNVSLVYLCFAVPIIFIATLIPVTINGLGIREAIYIYFFSGFAGSYQQILEFSLLNIIILLIPSLVGGIIYQIGEKE